MKKVINMPNSRLFFLVLMFLDLTLSSLPAQSYISVDGSFYYMHYRKADARLYGIKIEDINANSKWFLAVVNKEAAMIEKQVSLPADIVCARMTDDEKYIYIARIDSIYRFNCETKAIDFKYGMQFSLPGQLLAFTDLSCIKNQSNLVGVLIRNISTNQNFRIALYDNGVRVADTIQYYSSYYNITASDKFIFSDNGGVNGISVLKIKPEKLEPLPYRYSYRGYASGFPYYQDGMLFDTEGAVIEVSNTGELTRRGTLQTRATKTFIAPQFPSSKDTIFAHSQRDQKLWIQKFDKSNLQLLEEKNIIDLNNFGEIHEVVCFNTPYQFAMISQTGKLAIYSKCFSQPIPASLSDSIYYACRFDTLSITAPGNYPADEYYWSDGSRGKHYKRFIDPLSNLYELSYKVRDEFGCLSQSSPSVTIVYSDRILPLTVTTLDNGFTICEGGDIELRATTGGNFDDRIRFLWSNGAEGRIIRVNAPGNYTCRAVTPQGCFSYDMAQAVTITKVNSPTPPTPTISIIGGDGDPVICNLDSAKLSVNEVNYKYLWSDFYFNTWSNQRSLPVEEQAISVILVDNSTGCQSAPSKAIPLKYVQTPEKPTIQRYGNILSSSSSKGNQWYVNEVPIPGATQQFFTPVQNGIYTVTVTSEQGCTSLFANPLQF